MATSWSDRQKERGVRLSLTWFAARACWKKTIGGKMVYLKHPNSSEGYQAALLELAQRTTDPVAEAVQNFHENRAKAIVGILDKHPQLEAAVDAIRTGNQTDQAHSFGTQLDTFLRFKRLQAASGSRSVGTWGQLRNDLKVAEAFFKATFPMKHMSGANIKEYYLHLGESKGKGGKPRTEGRKKNLFRSFKQFILSYWREDDTELPASALKALKNPDLTFGDSSVSHSTTSLFTPEDIQVAMNLSKRWRAWVLLCLNCGFTQADIADLQAKQLVGNRLTHKRKKTRRLKNPPTVVYKLWPETVEAIAAAGSKDGLIFKTKDGQPLVVDRIGERDGEQVRQKWDNIGNRWAKLMACDKAPKKPLKFLRKTGRTMLTKNGHGMVADMYLGHAPQTMGAKHYDVINGEPFEPLDKATDHLRELLGIAKK